MALADIALQTYRTIMERISRGRISVRALMDNIANHAMMISLVADRDFLLLGNRRKTQCSRPEERCNVPWIIRADVA
jgi:hypothetical protein